MIPTACAQRNINEENGPFVSTAKTFSVLSNYISKGLAGRKLFYSILYLFDKIIYHLTNTSGFLIYFFLSFLQENSNPGLVEKGSSD
jgi:hypothetical protein